MMQDNYSRFIRESMRQAQCNYETIFEPCDCGRAQQDSACEREHEPKQTCQNDCDIPVMAFIPVQEFCRMYNEAEGLRRGTLFPALDKPFCGRGGKCCG
ncbi:MAG: spore coat associated protein CotJA [Firmicutes bacterium]|nr:spore coat associated protein CotJA [Bacillota bacterium]